MKKVIFSLTLLLIAIFVAVKLGNAQNNKTQDKKQTTETAAKCPVMSACCDMKVAERTEAETCDPAKCKEMSCDPAKCKEMGCDPAKCKASASCQKGNTKGNTAAVAVKTCNPAMCRSMK
jgi:hypothetical protein